MSNLILLCVFFAKLIDIHIGSDQEHREIEKIEHQITRDKENEIRQDSSSSEERQYEAIETLIRNGDVG